MGKLCWPTRKWERAPLAATVTTAMPHVYSLGCARLSQGVFSTDLFQSAVQGRDVNVGLDLAGEDGGAICPPLGPSWLPQLWNLDLNF